MYRFVSCIIGLLGFVLISGVAPAQDTSKDWKKDYGAFIEVLSPMFKGNPLHSEIKEKFDGQQVVWAAEFTKISLNGKNKVVWLKMPANTITLSNGEKAKTYTLFLVPKENNLKKWEDVKVGDTVQFKTTLKGNSDIPAVYVGQYLDGENAGKYHITIGTDDAELVEVVKQTKPWAKATPSQLLARFITSDFLNVDAKRVFIPADQQKQLEAWERNVAEGKTSGPILVVGGSANSAYNNIRLKMLETPLGKPDRTTKEQVKEIIGVKEGVAKPMPLETHWYGPVGFSFLEDSLVAVFYQSDPDKTDAATIKVVKVEKDKGAMTVTLSVEWAKAAVQPKADEVTVVFLFQDKKPPTLKLDAALLANLGEDNVFGVLESGGVWVLRTAVDRKQKRSADVLQLVGTDEKATADFRKNGEYKLTFRLSYAINREMPTDTIHVGLFQESDPKKWQQSSTSYKPLNKVVELPNK